MVLREVTICHFSVSSMRARHSDEPDLAREQIEQILLVSRRNNEAAEITGVLLFSDTNFSQALEGPRAEFERLYETLNHDRATRTYFFC